MFEPIRRADRWAALRPPLATAVAAVLFWLLLAPGTLRWLKAENGPVEGATAALYVVAAAAFAASARIAAPTRAALAVLMAGFAAREMDLHKAFTGKSVLKVSWYIGDAPWGAKLLAFVCVAAVGAAAATLALRHAGRVWRQWRRGDPVATTVVVFAATMVATKILDRAENILAEDYGIVFAPAVGLLLGSLEETVELSLPLVALVGAWQARRTRNF